MKVFVTKYALSTRKIEEVEVTPSSMFPGRLSDINNHWNLAYYLGRDAFQKREDAVVAADAARLKKIASLKKQIAKLEALRFE